MVVSTGQGGGVRVVQVEGASEGRTGHRGVWFRQGKSERRSVQDTGGYGLGGLNADG